MNTIYLKSLILLALSINLLSCRSTSKQVDPVYSAAPSTFVKAQALISAEEFENAIPHLKYVVEANNENSPASLFLLAKAYDQTAEPEKAVVSAEDYLEKKNYTLEQEVTARILILKNNLKLKNFEAAKRQKSLVENLIRHNLDKEAQPLFNGFFAALGFKCDRYCLEEVSFLNETQSLFVYFIERKSVSDSAYTVLNNAYSFFSNRLNYDFYDKDFKRHLAIRLLDSLESIKKYDLVSISKKQSKPSKDLFFSLDKVEQNIKKWINE